MSQNLDRLREITGALPAFPRSYAATYAPGYKEHEMEQGACRSWDILTTDRSSAAKWWNAKGTVFPEHAHDQHEWIFVLDGCILLTMRGEERRIDVGEWVYIEPGLRHSAVMPCDVWYIAITVPPSPDWPGADT